MVYEYIISFALSFIIAFCATPIARKIAFKIGAVDVPKDNRRMHKKPIARLGGLAIFAGFLVSIMYNVVGTFFNLDGIVFNRQLLGLLVGVVIIVGIGIIDDVVALSAKIKLAFQLAAAISFVCISDTRIISLTNPFASGGVSLLSDYISYPLTILWIIGVTNAINLIDGLDGLAAGVSSISYLSLFFVSLIMNDLGTALIISTLAGATLGFLPFNFNPAKIFMGDTGAMFLGFTLSVIAVQGTVKLYAAVSIAIPLLVLGLPIFDTAFAIIRRLLSGKSIMEADRGHLHHRLIDMGLSHKQSVVVMYTTSAALGLCAIVLAEKGVWSAIILVIAVSIFVIAGARYMSEIENEESVQELKEDNVG